MICFKLAGRTFLRFVQFALLVVVLSYITQNNLCDMDIKFDTYEQFINQKKSAKDLSSFLETCRMSKTVPCTTTGTTRSLVPLI